MRRLSVALPIVLASCQAVKQESAQDACLRYIGAFSECPGASNELGFPIPSLEDCQGLSDSEHCEAGSTLADCFEFDVCRAVTEFVETDDWTVELQNMVLCYTIDGSEPETEPCPPEARLPIRF